MDNKTVSEIKKLRSKKEGYTKIGPGNEKQVQGLGREYCKCSQMWNCYIPLTKAAVQQPKYWEKTWQQTSRKMHLEQVNKVDIDRRESPFKVKKMKSNLM